MKDIYKKKISRRFFVKPTVFFILISGLLLNGEENITNLKASKSAETTENSKLENLENRIKKLQDRSGILISGYSSFFSSSEITTGKTLNTNAASVKNGMFLNNQINIKAYPVNEFSGGVSLYMNSDLTGYWGEGTTLTVKNLFLEMALANRVGIRIGDIKKFYSPLTVSLKTPGESAITYENILENEKTRSLRLTPRQKELPLFGADLRMGLKNPKTGYYIDFDMFSSRLSTEPFDRFLNSAKMNTGLPDIFDLQTVYTFTGDLTSTGNATSTDLQISNALKSRVFSLKTSIYPLKKFAPSILKKIVNIDFEIAHSKMNYLNRLASTSMSNAYRFKFRTEIKGIALFTGFRYVPSSFYAPAAQQSAYSLAQPGSPEQNLPPVLLEKSYNESFLFNLSSEADFDFSEPFAEATPNRQAFEIGTEVIQFHNALKFNFLFKKLTELVSVGVSPLTEFSKIDTSLRLKLHKILGVKYIPMLAASFYYETAVRPDDPSQNVDDEIDNKEIRLKTDLTFKPNLKWQTSLALMYRKSQIKTIQVNDYNYFIIQNYTPVEYSQTETALLYGISAFIKNSTLTGVYKLNKIVRNEMVNHDILNHSFYTIFTVTF